MNVQWPGPTQRPTEFTTTIPGPGPLQRVVSGPAEPPSPEPPPRLRLLWSCCRLATSLAERPRKVAARHLGVEYRNNCRIELIARARFVAEHHRLVMPSASLVHEMPNTTLHFTTGFANRDRVRCVGTTGSERARHLPELGHLGRQHLFRRHACTHAGQGGLLKLSSTCINSAAVRCAKADAPVTRNLAPFLRNAAANMRCNRDGLQSAP